MYISTPPSPEVENFQIKIYCPAGDWTPDLLNQRQRHATIWASTASLTIGNLSVENEEKLKYLWVTETNTNDIREEIERRLNMGNACYYSVEKMLSSLLLPKKLKLVYIKQIYYLLYCMVVKLGLSPWERSTGLESSRIQCLEIYFRLWETKLPETGETYIMMSYMNCIIHLM